MKGARAAMVVAGAWLWAWAFPVLVAVDQLANAILGGDPDETISSRAHKATLKAERTGKRWGCILCRVLDWIDPGHCAKAVEWDEGQGPISGS